MKQKAELVIFKAQDGNVKLDVNIENETVWLSLDQMSELFERDKSTISRHIKNIFKDGELSQGSVVANFATTASDGKVYDVTFYDLDVIISVGYRVKSQRGVEFRKWANGVLKNYILKGYAVNNNRINELGEVIRIMKRADNRIDSKQILDVIEKYTVALDLLDDYDHQKIKKPDGNTATYTLTYEECREVIDGMKFGSESDLFGNEKDDSFKSSISAIYQTFGGQEVYPSLEEKAANLLYLITKNHSFSDGNKRIAAALFLYFLNKNGTLFEDGEKIIDDYTLVAITIMTAESKPAEKETMIKLIMNFLN
mgnify:CR=1 FL=1